MRNLDVQCCVYKIRNTVNDKLYIGFTSCLEVRWEQHKKEAKRGNTKKHIYRDMNLYGIDAFAIEIIEEGIPICRGCGGEENVQAYALRIGDNERYVIGWCNKCARRVAAFLLRPVFNKSA